MKFSLFTVIAPDLTPDGILLYLKEYGYEGVEWRYKEIPAAFREEEASYWRNNLCTILPGFSQEDLLKDIKAPPSLGSPSTSDFKGLLTPYLQERERYILLENMLTFPKTIGEGRDRCHCCASRRLERRPVPPAGLGPGQGGRGVAQGTQPTAFPGNAETQPEGCARGSGCAHTRRRIRGRDRGSGRAGGNQRRGRPAYAGALPGTAAADRRGA